MRETLLRTLAGSMGILMSVCSGALALERGTPEPISRPAPSLGLYYYCIDPENVPEDGYIGSVTVGYDLTQWGRTENITIVSSTNECLELSARTITKVWVYDRNSILSTPQKDRSLQATLEYRITDDFEERIRSLMEADAGLDRDAQPLLRIPPAVKDFRRCIRSDRKKIERVTLEFDVTEEGDPTNVRVIETTNKCFNKAAIKSAEQWIYGPKIVDRTPAPRAGVHTTIEFQIGR